VDLRHLTTGRLRLDAVVPGDLGEHFALLSDPQSWAHYPTLRHTSREQTAAGIEAAVGHWAADGLGYWTARLRDDLPADHVPPGLRPGAMVGTGGCATRAGTSWWNLYYRLTRAAWGRGLAAEIVDAALDAAGRVDPDRPVIAYLLEHNEESRRRAERSGLTLVWRGPDTGNPDPDAVRLIYADRPLPAEILARATRLP
jgi:RimJ/RimL family protein N-acetyltransferase